MEDTSTRPGETAKRITVTALGLLAVVLLFMLGWAAKEKSAWDEAVAELASQGWLPTGEVPVPDGSEEARTLAIELQQLLTSVEVVEPSPEGKGRSSKLGAGSTQALARLLGGEEADLLRARGGKLRLESGSSLQLVQFMQLILNQAVEQGQAGEGAVAVRHVQSVLQLFELLEARNLIDLMSELLIRDQMLESIEELAAQPGVEGPALVSLLSDLQPAVSEERYAKALGVELTQMVRLVEQIEDGQGFLRFVAIPGQLGQLTADLEGHLEFMRWWQAGGPKPDSEYGRMQKERLEKVLRRSAENESQRLELIRRLP